MFFYLSNKDYWIILNFDPIGYRRILSASSGSQRISPDLRGQLWIAVDLAGPLLPIFDRNGSYRTLIGGNLYILDLAGSQPAKEHFGPRRTSIGEIRGIVGLTGPPAKFCVPWALSEVNHTSII